MQRIDPSSEDCVFRYTLGRNDIPHYHDRLVELVRANLENILNTVIPMENGREVKLDSFKLLNDVDTVYEIFPPEHDTTRAPEQIESAAQSCGSVALYEPRIDFIKNQLNSLLAVVDLEREGRVVEIDGFRLKNLGDWMVPSTCDPIEVFGHIATRCSCDCVFCYLKGNPSSVALGLPMKSADEEYQEAMTRTKYFRPQAGRCLFPALGGIYEPLTHPRCLEVLRMVRDKSSKPIRITTNGENLTPDMIAGLSDLQPVYLYLSLNSASPRRRKKLMKSRCPQIAIDALPLLRENGIPYAVLIVPWPEDTLEEMLKDLHETVSYADKGGAHLVEINLPGHSRYFSAERLFDLDEVWSATVDEVRKLREMTTCPIVTMPSMFEENLYEPEKNLAKVIGVVRNSPAALCGLRMGDIILEINGLGVRNRPQARDILSFVRRSREEQIGLVVRRGSDVVRLTMELNRHSYPYARDTDNHLGVIFLGTGLRLVYMERFRDIIQSHKAKRVLFLSSALVKPTLEQSISDSHLFGDASVKIDIEIPSNRFFGGNVFMGDLLVVQDFIDHIREHVEAKGSAPDLIVIPSSPFNMGGWRRDLTGRVYLDIERVVGIPVEILECETIYD